METVVAEKARPDVLSEADLVDLHREVTEALAPLPAVYAALACVSIRGVLAKAVSDSEAAAACLAACRAAYPAADPEPWPFRVDPWWIPIGPQIEEAIERMRLIESGQSNSPSDKAGLLPSARQAVRRALARVAGRLW